MEKHNRDFLIASFYYSNALLSGKGERIYPEEIESSRRFE